MVKMYVFGKNKIYKAITEGYKKTDKRKIKLMYTASASLKPSKY